MNKLVIATIVTLILSFSVLHARNAQNYYRYGDIKTILNKRAIVEIAKSEVRRLVIQKKVPKSWKFAPLLNIEKDHTISEWIVSFNNLKMKHKENQTLFIHITANGDVISDSYTRMLHPKK